MNRNRNRHGFGSRERGIKSLRYLKRRYENTENCSSHDLAKNLIKKNIPKPLEGFTDILSKAVMRITPKGQLSPTCRMMARLIEYEIRATGYEITKGTGKKHERIKVWRDFSNRRENVFVIRNYDVTYPSEKAEKMKREFERDFLNLYGLNIEFGSPP